MQKNRGKKLLKLLILIGLLGIGHASGQLAHVDIFSTNCYPIYARFESVAGLKVGHPVKMRGLKIGKVTDLIMDKERQAALAKLKIDDDISLHDDAIATIKMQGLIGKNYVSIDPGGSGNILKSDDIILDTESLVDIGDLISRYTFGQIGTKIEPGITWQSQQQNKNGLYRLAGGGS